MSVYGQKISTEFHMIMKNHYQQKFISKYSLGETYESG